MFFLFTASGIAGYLGAMGADRYFEDDRVKELRKNKKKRKVVWMWVAKRKWNWGKPVVRTRSTKDGFVIDMEFVPFRDK